MKSLVLGGARSGKSRLAEQRVLAYEGMQPIYIATAWGGDGLHGDAEMQQRIKKHKQERSSRFSVVEEQLHLTETLMKYDGVGVVFLVDCLTLWLNNCLHHKVWQQEKNALLELLPQLKAHIVFVSNEVGSGIVPMGELSRQFADEAGWLNQALAKLCDQVDLVVAGCMLNLKKGAL